MKRLLSATLALIISASIMPAAMAGEELSPPCVALNSPIVEKSNSSFDAPVGMQDSLKAEVPFVADGKSPGIDIVNDSLKYHSNLGMSNTGAMGNQGSSNPYAYNLNATMNNHSLNQNPYTANTQQSMQYSAMNQMAGRQNMYYGNQAQMMPQNQMQISPDMMKKAVGVVGAAALLGVFVKSGGLKGVTQSMGIDNHRHIRGSSIGGY